jgi:hypothetical protein
MLAALLLAMPAGFAASVAAIVAGAGFLAALAAYAGTGAAALILLSLALAVAPRRGDAARPSGPAGRGRRAPVPS